MTALELAEKIAEAVLHAVIADVERQAAWHRPTATQAVLQVMHENNVWFVENQHPDWPEEHEQRLDFDHDPPESI